MYYFFLSIVVGNIIGFFSFLISFSDDISFFFSRDMMREHFFIVLFHYFHFQMGQRTPRCAYIFFIFFRKDFLLCRYRRKYFLFLSFRFDYFASFGHFDYVISSRCSFFAWYFFLDFLSFERMFSRLFFWLAADCGMRRFLSFLHFDFFDFFRLFSLLMMLHCGFDAVGLLFSNVVMIDFQPSSLIFTLSLHFDFISLPTFLRLFRFSKLFSDFFFSRPFSEPPAAVAAPLLSKIDWFRFSIDVSLIISFWLSFRDYFSMRHVGLWGLSMYVWNISSLP